MRRVRLAQRLLHILVILGLLGSDLGVSTPPIAPASAPDPISFARTGLPQPVSAATYDQANELTTWGSATLTYDANGNLTNDGTGLDYDRARYDSPTLQRFISEDPRPRSRGGSGAVGTMARRDPDGAWSQRGSATQALRADVEAIVSALSGISDSCVDQFRSLYCVQGRFDCQTA